jgi:hypothetical protein
MLGPPTSRVEKSFRDTPQMVEAVARMKADQGVGPAPGGLSTACGAAPARSRGAGTIRSGSCECAAASTAAPPPGPAKCPTSDADFETLLWPRPRRSCGLPSCIALQIAEDARVRRGQSELEPVSADIRTGLCSRAGSPPGKGSARPETRAAFLPTLADSERQRPHYPASPAAKPRKVKDYSDGTGKSELRRTAWWSWQDSNLQPCGY